jgi:hypothetical protein
VDLVQILQQGTFALRVVKKGVSSQYVYEGLVWGRDQEARVNEEVYPVRASTVVEYKKSTNFVHPDT